MKRNKLHSGPASPENARGIFRKRTLAHLEDLMRAATTVVVGIVLACGARAQPSRPPQIVDALPRPVGCCENPDELLLRRCLSQQNRWMKSGMKWTLQLSLAAPPGPTRLSFEGLKREAVKVYGLSIIDMKVDSQRVGFALAAGASSRQATLQFPVLCNDKKITLKFVLDLSKLPSENASVPVRLAK